MNKEEIESLNKQVDILAVSKYHTKEEIDVLAKNGFSVFGENRVQEFLEKYDPKYSWHLIGHLQTNKVKYIIGKVDCIESLDSMHLAKEINKQAMKKDIVQNVLIQIKISKDEKKTGLPFEEIDSFLQEVNTLPNLNIKGFMCVASNTTKTHLIEDEFERMHQLFLKYKQIYPSISTLSMGMSSDYPIAIKHGSTEIRLGHALFE